MAPPAAPKHVRRRRTSTRRAARLCSCRWLMSAALTRMAATDREPPPDYAACLLVDRPDRSGAAETLETNVFEVRRDSSLAYVN